MALQTSGPISLADIHVEAAGSGYAATSISSLNDTDIRNLTAASGRTINSTLGTEIDFADFYGASSLSTMTTTNYMRQASSGTANFAGYSEKVTTGGIVFNVGGGFYLKLIRSDPYVYLQIREYTSANGSNWYNTSGTATGLSTTYVNMGRFNLTGITAIALDWTTPTTGGTGSYSIGGSTGGGATYSASDNSYQTVSNGQSIGMQFRAQASAECYANNNVNAYTFVTARARKSGYADHPLGSYLLRARGNAISNNCF